jgi:rRNA maturation endonuclease Nob1
MYRPIEFDGIEYFCAKCGEIFGELDGGYCPYCGTEYIEIDDEREIANILYFKEKLKERNTSSR